MERVLSNIRTLGLVCSFLFLILQTSFAQLDCSNAATFEIGKTIKGNTTNGKSNISTYNNDPWWQLTGPEIVHKVEWTGGQMTIKLSNKSAALDLLLLRSCNNNDVIASGGGNSGTKESSIVTNLEAGTYYVIVDGWAGAKGTYDLSITQLQLVSILTDVRNRIQRTFFLRDSVLYEQKGNTAVQMTKGVESIAASFGYVANPNTGAGNQDEVLTIKKYGQAKPKVFLNENFDTDYLRQRLFCTQKNLSMFGDLVFDGETQILTGSDILRCENGQVLSHQNNGQIKLFTGNNSWLDISQIITVNNTTYYIKQSDNTVWMIGGNAAIGTNAKLLQDNDNQLIKIDPQGNYQRWDGKNWSNLTPKYISVSPEMIDEGFWFFMQSKPLLESTNIQADQKKGLTFDSNEKLTMEQIPATGNCDRFLWRTKDIGGGKRLLINKAKGENFPLLIATTGTLTFSTGQGEKEWTFRQSDVSKYGTNAYQLLGASKALTFNGSVQSENPANGNKNQTWTLQFNQMVKDYFLPLPTRANLQQHYVDNPNVNINTSATEIAASYNKFLKGTNGVTYFATNTSSDWVLVNHYFIINNVMNAVVSPKPADSKVSPNLVKTLDAMKGQSLILISKNDLNANVPKQFFTTWITKQNASQFRGMAAYAHPKRAILANEELTCKTGIVNRPLDNIFRRFDHGVHEFTHALQELCGWIPIVDANAMCENERNRSSECFCFDTQNWFNSNANSNYTYPGIRAYNTQRADFMKKIFNADNTWMPAVDLRQDGYNPSGSALNPAITLTNNLTAFNATEGTNSASQSYTVKGSDLTNNIVVTAPTDFQVSLDNSAFTNSVTVIAATAQTTAGQTIFVRFNKAVAGTSSGNITHTSTGTTIQNVAVTGTATQIILSTNDELPQLSFEVYPNPTSSEIFVKGSILEMQEVQLVITDVVGKTLIQKTIKPQQSSFVYSIKEVSSLPAGAYYLKLATGNHSKSSKIFKN
jgi:hypothetical protein